MATSSEMGCNEICYFLGNPPVYQEMQIIPTIDDILERPTQDAWKPFEICSAVLKFSADIAPKNNLSMKAATGRALERLLLEINRDQYTGILDLYWDSIVPKITFYEDPSGS